ncbi:MAG: hypothetical protein ACR2ML_06475 [Solirubrobacteraceae bacterium]
MVDSEATGSPEEREDAGTVVDPAVLAERRVKRAELAEQAHAHRAAEAEEALSAAEAELHRAQLRLERANDDRASLEARLGMREHELRTARHRVDAERQQRTEEAGDSGDRLHATEVEAAGLLGRLTAAEARVAELEDEADGLRRRLEEASGSEQAPGPFTEELRERVLAAEETVTRLREDLAEQVAAEQRARSATDVIKSELEAVREGARARQARQREIPQRLRELATAGAELRAQVALLEARWRSAEARWRSAEAAARRSDDALVALQAEHVGLRKETERGAESLLDAHRQLADAQRTAQRAREDLDRERTRADAQIAELSLRSEDQLARSAIETVDLRGRLEAETQDLRARLEAETADLRARLEAERRARIADGERLADSRAAGVAAAAEVAEARAALGAEVQTREALEWRLGEEVSALREELAQAHEHARRREQRDHEAQLLASELVATANQALSDVEEQIAEAETTVSAVHEELARERVARERAEAELATAREETLRTEARMRAQVDLKMERRRRSDELLAKLGIELARERDAAREGEAARERESGATVPPSSEPPAAELAAEERLATTRRATPGPTRRESAIMRAAAPAGPDGGERPLALDAGAARETPGDPAAPAETAGVEQTVPAEASGVAHGVPVDEARPKIQAASDPLVEAGPGWLSRAIDAMAQSDPETASALLVAVLPLQSEVVARNLDYDLHLGPGGWWRVAAAPGLVRPLMALSAPRPSREADLRLETEPAALVQLIDGARPRRARRHGRMKVKGSRRAAKAAVRSLTGIELDFAPAARAGLWIDPRLVYLALSRAIAPAWTASHRFVVAHEVVGEQVGTWYVHVEGPAPIHVAAQPAEPPVATVRCSAHAFLPLLTSQPAPGGEKAALRGDLEAISLLREWVGRAQTGA